MIGPAENWFLDKDEPVKGCLHFLRAHILKHSPGISERWQYGMPFYSYQGKRICYLWVHKKLYQPYIGIVDGNQIDHPDLLIEKRARMKILLIDPHLDIPVDKINSILTAAMAFDQSAQIINNPGNGCK